MKDATAEIYLDELRPRKNGTCSVKIKITHDRKRKYYPTGINKTPDEFNQLMFGERRTAIQKKAYIKILKFQAKAQKVLDELTLFTFDSFDERYFEQRNVTNNVSFAFEKYIELLMNENRIGTAVSYQCAINSLELFKPNLTFADITPRFLREYHSQMINQNKSITTVGIYLRSLRAIYNNQNIADNSIYPFGAGKHRYSIPAGRNVKKALTVQEIAKIYNYKSEPHTSKAMAMDYWLFLYLSNGMNVKDFCQLRWRNIDGDTLTYQRAKTKRTLKESKTISVALKPETIDIIRKWGQPSILKDAYIFPHLQAGVTAVKEREIYQTLTKLINKHMKQIATELDINKNITTYFARHSFATVLKRSGAKIEMISELLGHSSVATTESYLDGFEKEQLQEQTNALTAGFKQAN